MPVLQSTTDSLNREGKDALAAGRYQGVHSRRVSRCLMAIWLGILFFQPDVLESRSVGSRLYALAITLAVVAICDLWFSRRMGLTINERGITLHYAFHRKQISWSEITGFEWRHWNSPRSEWIWITRNHGDPIRIPALQRAPGGNNTGFWSPVYSALASSNLRTSHGGVVDAMTILQDALAAQNRLTASHAHSR
jgi:hypothetical protein